MDQLYEFHQVMYILMATFHYLPKTFSQSRKTYLTKKVLHYNGGIGEFDPYTSYNYKLSNFN